MITVGLKSPPDTYNPKHNSSYKIEGAVRNTNIVKEVYENLQK